MRIIKLRGIVNKQHSATSFNKNVGEQFGGKHLTRKETFYSHLT